MIYFSSDTHFSHNKNFLWEPRGFKDQWEMNEKIIENWNAIITEEDDVYLLGDIVLSDTESGIEALKRLNGKIHIIRGNHDSENKMELYAECPNVVELCEGKFLKVGNQSFFLSHYPCLTSNYDDDKPLNKKIINVCGHTHTKNKWHDFDKGLIYHVELDAHDCKPVSTAQVINDIKEKEYL